MPKRNYENPTYLEKFYFLLDKVSIN